MYKAMTSDHVMLYKDVNGEQLFSSIINRPVLNSSREFIIEHADKVEIFLDKFNKEAKEIKTQERIIILKEQSKSNGASQQNINK